MALIRTQGQDWFIADIGATNSRLAITSGTQREMRGLVHFRNREFASAEALIQSFMSSNPGIAHGAIAIAAPVLGDDIRMINRDWRFNRRELRQSLGLQSLSVINDFHAIAYALPGIGESSRIEIGSASQYRSGNIAVMGPGSGLGAAAWIKSPNGGAAMCGEGGHVSLAPRNRKEEKIVRHFRDVHGHCSAERVLSGPGLAELHFAMHGERPARPEDITENPADPRSAETLQQFFLFLAGVAADLALTTGALGGLYIAGGIVPSCIDAFRRSGFRERFEDKNRYRTYMQAIPTWVITDPVPGLRGLISYIRMSASAEPQIGTRLD